MPRSLSDHAPNGDAPKWDDPKWDASRRTTDATIEGIPGKDGGMPSDIPLVRVRPRRSVLVMAVVSLCAALVPVTAMLVLLASTSGGWLAAGLAELVIVLICVVLGFRQMGLFAQVTATALEGNGWMTPTVRVPLDRIASAHLVDTYAGQSSETITQLLVLDADGRRLFRLRGNFWTEGSLERIAAALPVPVRHGEEAISIRRFFTEYPSSEYWFENKTWLKVGAIVLGCVAASALALWIMTAVG
jgi:hypothetical protein